MTSGKPDTFQTLLERLPAYGERRALGLRREFGSRWWTYRRLHAEALKAAGLLQRLGIGRGHRLVIWAPNSPEWVGIFLGAMARGAVVVPVDDDALPDHVAQVVRDLGVELLFSRPRPDLADLPVPARSIYDAYRRRPAHDSATRVLPVEDDEPALIYYTSGTTAKPRAVVLTHGNLIAQMARFRRWRWLVGRVPFRLMVLAPLSHVQGMVLGVCIPLDIGLTVLYTDSIHPARLLRAIRDERLTLMATVPRALQTLGSELKRRPYGNSTLGERHAGTRNRALRRHRTFLAARSILGYRFWLVLVGGAPLPRDDEVFWRDTGCLVVQGYGLTETTAMVAVNPPLLGTAGSVGRPLAQQEVRLAADGEILVRGPNVTPGRPGPAGATDDAAEDGFLRTGDLGRFDRRGRLFILGRKTDLIVTGEGFNVQPEAVEAALNRQPEVADSVVCAVDREGHASVHAVLLLRREASPETIVARANAALQPFQRIVSWSIWPERDFPRTRLLKVKRGEVSRRVAVRHPGAVSPASTAMPSVEAIRAEGDLGRKLEMLTRRIAEAKGDVPSEEDLELARDLGLGSIEIAELLVRAEQRLDVALDGGVLPADATVADLRTLVADGGRRVRRRPARQPRWSLGRPGNLLRAVTQPLAVGGWSRLCARSRGVWRDEPGRLVPPVIFAAAPHRHWLDVLAVTAALPGRLRRGIVFITDRGFREHAGDAATLGRRLLFSFMFHLLVPATFRFAIVPRFGGTRQGLREVCRLIGRGRSVIVFPKGLYFSPEDADRHDEGTAWIALQTGAPIVPVRLEGNHGLGVRPRWRRRTVTVRFGQPITPEPDLSPEALVTRVENALSDLEADGTGQPDL